MINSYKDLIVWQKAVALSIEIYGITRLLPREELFGLASQMRRAAISIASNIAEGRHRGSKKDFVNFLRIAFSSGAELETQIVIAKQVYSELGIDFSRADSLLDEVMRILNKMIRNINPKS